MSWSTKHDFGSEFGEEINSFIKPRRRANVKRLSTFVRRMAKLSGSVNSAYWAGFTDRIERAG
jgi:hypothetical protein